MTAWHTREWIIGSIRYIRYRLQKHERRRGDPCLERFRAVHFGLGIFPHRRA